MKKRKNIKEEVKQKPVSTEDPKPQTVDYASLEGLSLNWIYFIFSMLFIVRGISAFINPIADCDETYNYWEPTHLLIYGYGFQTWEYSPLYALRSYLYVLIYAVWGKLAVILGVDQKILVFFILRIIMCGMCAVAETYFIKNIYERFGKRIATFSTIFLLFSNGMFNAAPSYVPSTFAMICLLIAFGSWFSISLDEEEEKLKYIVCIATAGTAVLLGWPFCIVCIIPLALDCIFSFGFFKSLKTAIIVTVSLLGAIAYVDYIFYKRVFFTPVHLVLYNKGSGSEKYGVEPWNFFFKNLTLAFNIAFWLALICPIVIYLHSKIVKKSVGYIRHFRWVVYILPFQIWFWFFTVIKHKEERFLFVVYPTICLAAAITLELIAQIVDFLFLGNKFAQISKGDSSKGVIYPKRSFFSYILVGLALFVFTLLGISRTAAVFTNYHAPFIIYGNLYNDLIREGKSNESINICVGKEWYRFPSSFFLPSENVKLQFIRSEFRGLLPKPFEKVNATSVIPTDMNSDNREEMSRYIDPKDCDYLVDFDFEDQKEEHYVRDSKNWEIIYKIPFLDVSRSPPLTRSFYIPKYSAQNNVYGDYCLLKSRRK